MIDRFVLITLLSSSLSLAINSNAMAKVSDKDIELYFQNQEISPQNGHVEHEKYGRMAATEEPYASAYADCQRKVFKGKGYKFGGVSVSDPQKIRQFLLDFHINLMVHQMPESDKKQEMIKPVFYHPSFFKQYKKLRQKISKMVSCVQKNGWSNVKVDKK